MAHKYTIYDENGAVVCQSFSDDPPTSPVWRMIIIQKDLDKLGDSEFLKVGVQGEKEPVDAKIIQKDGNVVSIKGVRVRENLRIPVSFSTYIYPVSHNWIGRAKIISNDLSCGGFAFFSDRELEMDEIVEAVVPITSKPLILRLKVLRTRMLDDNRKMYAAEFHEMLHEEEMLVRETVFKLQLRYTPD